MIMTVWEIRTAERLTPLNGGKYTGMCDVLVERARELQICFYDYSMCKEIENCIVTTKLLLI